MRPAAIIVQPSPRVVFVTAVLGSLMFAGIAAAPESNLKFLQGEDGIVEIVSALAYPVGFFFAVRLAQHANGWSRAHWLLWAVLCVLFFGEETSWLQHWIGYKTPAAVEAVNAQSEFNLHNLKILTLDTGLVTTKGISFSSKSLTSSQHLFYLGFFVYFLLLPLSRSVLLVNNVIERLGVPKLTWRFVTMLWIPIAASAVMTYLHRNEPLRNEIIGEAREMVFAIAIAWFVASAYHYARRGQNSR
jgi:hypothetical protein